MAPNMADEVYSHTAGPLVVLIPVQAKWSQESLELSLEKWCGLAASGISCALGTHQDDVLVGTRPFLEWGVFLCGFKRGSQRRRERCGSRWGGGDVVIDQLWHENWSDVVDEGESR